MKNFCLRLIAFAALSFLLPGSANSAFGQEWTSANGKFKVEAKFIQLDNGEVELERKSNGKVIKVALSKLSDDDQKRARKLQEAADKKKMEMAEKKKMEMAGKKMGKSDLLEQLELKCEAGFSEMSNFGSDKDEQTPIVIKVTAIGKPAVDATQYGKLKLESFADSEGKALKPEKDKFSMDDISKTMVKVDRESSFFSSHPDDGVTIEINLPAKDQPESISKLSGTFSLMTGGTRTMEAIQELPSQYGKRVKSAALQKAGLKIKVEKPENDNGNFGVSFMVSGKTKTINRLYVGDSNKEKFESENGFSTSGFNKQMNYSFFFSEEIPEDAILYVEVVSGASVLEVPFEFSDIEVSDSK